LLIIKLNQIEVKAPNDYPVHNLDTSLNYTTIQEAIDAPETLNGHTISVDSGIYFEHVYINKSISLVGENRSTTIIDGNDTGTVIAVYADFAMVRGFSIQHSGFFVGLPSGIEVGSSNCTIIGNTIVLNKGGISLLFGGNHTISNNIISSSYYGINIIYSENNKIFHNSFLNNTQHVYITGSINIWDNGYPSGGNYWSDYAGVDLFSGPYQNESGSDGIGDTLYAIDANNRDNFPLMTPYVGLVGDVNADGIVDIADIYLIALAYGTMPGQPGYNLNLDINSDGIIDIADIYIAALHYGETDP
jgi:parallel beta-helix repeat protein